jgi:uncharacterized short protein YbdD (DUF466 family)
VLLRNVLKPILSCREVTGASLEECFARAQDAATKLRRGWLRVIGAPDYRAYLMHHAARHPGTVPMAERDYVKMFIERRFNGPGAGRCC